MLGARPLGALFFAFACVACVERGDVLVGGVAGSGGTTNEPGGGHAGDSMGSAGGENGTGASGVSIGFDHACAIVAGAAHCWGGNEYGQLGVGDRSVQLAPARVVGDHDWRQIAVGSFRSCGLDDDGRVLCWGENARGGLGVGDRSERTTPTAVALPARAVSLSGDFEHACAVLSDNRLFCWGNNEEGQLGQDDEYPGKGSPDADALVPIRVPGPDYQSADAGQGHTCAIAVDGALYCWGRNTPPVLGTGAGTTQIRTPARVGADNDWAEVVAGQAHTCGRKRDLTIWCWGMNTGAAMDDGYPLGIADASELPTPTRVGDASDWARLRSNTFHTCGVKQNAELWCWGRNIEGQLGLGDIESRPTPVLIGVGYTDVSPGRFATCALTSDAVVQCAGANESGQLGLGDTERRNTLTSVGFEP
jgi:hypothetical protein